MEHRVTWHILDVRAIWIKEFAAAMATEAEVLGWCPQITGAGRLRNHETETLHDDPELRVRYFPLQRGFAKFPVNILAREGNRIARRILNRTEVPADTVLVCTTPHYAPVAELWPGPVVYYATDLFKAYGDEPEFIQRVDRRMCHASTLVCPNSQRIADYFVNEAQCAPAKISIIPNATRRSSLMDQISASDERPTDIADLPRPIAGVIGNLAANMDWILLRRTIERTPWLSWLFVGPADMQITDFEQRQARQHLMACGGRVRFIGAKKYGELQAYARSIDVAVLPYRKGEPTYSGSSTRFYEHLAACRPILATRGFEELLHKEPLLRLSDSDEQMAAALEELRKVDFHDGREELRRRASQTETWESRALQMRNSLMARLEGERADDRRVANPVLVKSTASAPVL